MPLATRILRQAQARGYLPRLLSISELAYLYRRDDKTIAADARSGVLPSQRRGKAVYCSAKRAEELYGVDGPHALGLH